MQDNEIRRAIRKVYGSASDGNKKTFCMDAIRFIEQAQREAFMEGYRYAITLLEESVVK